ncbi:MAG: histidinol-phosphate transaminase [Firmicutes bacterium]|nr:histidinol-phosphate transaminase [Bacillota bacterium]
MGELSGLARESLRDIAPYRPGKPIAEVQRELGLSDVIKMASNENLFGPSPRASAAAREAVAEMHYYPDADCYLLREALAGLWGVPRESLVFGSGSDEVVRLLGQAFLQEGDEAVVPDPSFPGYLPAVQGPGATPRVVPLRRFRLDLEAMAACFGPRTRMVFLCNPNNPTGTIVEQEETELFLARLPERAILVVDEAYGEYVDSEDFPWGIEMFRRGLPVVVLRTFSKVYGLAGLRLGYAVAPPEIAEGINRIRPVFNANVIAQQAALAAVEDRAHVEKVKELTRAARLTLYKELDSRGIEYVPSETNFILVRLGDAGGASQALMRRGVIVRPADFFGYPEWIRVTVGPPSYQERFLTALDAFREQA